MTQNFMWLTPESILSSFFTQQKLFVEMGLVEGEEPARVIASFFQTSGELGAGTANTNNQA